MVDPTRLVVIFDGEHHNPRSDILTEYKKNRPGPDETKGDPFDHQYGDVRAALDYMGIKHREINQAAEADEVISSYCERYKGEAEIVISSFDSDFFQFVCENVSLLRYRGKETYICGREYILEKCGVEPSLYADFKSLTGDTADNIKGIPGVGVKTAAMLVNSFGGVEEIIKNASEIKKPKIREAVILGSERLLLNKSIIKLDGSARIPLEIGELAYSYGGETTRGVLAGIDLLK